MPQNPILSGFYPDPSVCRVGEDFYLVTSSFEFSPGVPVFHSRDLISWRQLCYVLTRPSQLNLRNAGVSDGIFAPTLRYNSGVFYMITSNRCAKQGNHFFVTATDPEGPWSEPVWITLPDGTFPGGLDPSLFFDNDGRVYFHCVAWDEAGQGVGQAEVDLSSGKLKEPLLVIWHGTGGTFPEGPHIYKRFGYYYVMIAEGGTEYGHKVTLARAKHIAGPYEACPAGPILTQAVQRAQESELQGAGHGDLVEDPTGQWWLITHAFRPSVGKLHHLGRETVLTAVRWADDGWPVCGSYGCLTAEIPPLGVAARAEEQRSEEIADLFDRKELPLHWNFLRCPEPGQYTVDAGELVLTGCALGLNNLGSPTWAGMRQRHFHCVFRAQVLYDPAEGEEGGLTVYQTPEHHYDIVIRKRASGKVALLRKVVGDIEQTFEEAPLPEGILTLQVDAARLAYSFSVTAIGKRAELGSGRTQLLSTEAMLHQNFTGTYFALFAKTPDGMRSSGFRIKECRYMPKN